MFTDTHILGFKLLLKLLEAVIFIELVIKSDIYKKAKRWIPHYRYIFLIILANTQHIFAPSIL